MEKSWLFFIIFVLTIVLTRIFLHLRPTPSPTIHGFRLHHYMYGVIIGLVGILLSNITLFAIGLGLFIDEVPYLLIRGKGHTDYISYISIAGVVVLISLVYFLRLYLVNIL